MAVVLACNQICLRWQVLAKSKRQTKDCAIGVLEAEIRLWVAEGAGVGGPFSKPGGDHVGDDAADIDLLRRIVVGTGVVAGDGHRPCLVTGMETGQEARRIVDVLARVEHVFDAAKMRRVVVMVDLHAAQIDQRLALALGIGEGGKGFSAASRKDRFSFYIQCVGLKATFVSGFGETDGIEDAGRDAVAACGAQDLRLARIRSRAGGGAGKAR